MSVLELADSRRVTLLAKTQGRCAYCGTRLTLEGMTADHVYPRAKGGGSGLVNLMPACFSCNSDKGQQTIEQWRRRIGRSKLGMPSFTKEHRKWLATQGFQFPDEARQHVFWFEQGHQASVAEEPMESVEGTHGKTRERERIVITNQDEFNQNLTRALYNLYILSLPKGDDTMKACDDVDIAVRDRLSELDAYAWREEYARFNGLSEEERDAELDAKFESSVRIIPQ